ncbi:MAG TPA: PTS sugar transporter subunit IIC [Longimicrobiales bacterium]|nr:PTS sugar transporter subunit IIC [Longimicrobiales bacterium]
MTWLLLALLGGVVAVDGAALGQVMLSRPLVAGAAAGWIVGRPAEGLVLGALLELFSLIVLPVGAARYPEAGTGAAAAAAAYGLAAPPGGSAGGLALAVAFGLAWEQVGGATVYQLRLLNERLVGAPAAGGAYDAGTLERRHLLAIGLDFVRGSAVTLLGAAAGAALLHVLGGRWGFGGVVTLGALTLAATAMVGAVVGIFGGLRERWVPFVVGVACGLLLLLT